MNFEQKQTLENNEKKESKILLKFFRHSIKGEKQPDDRLTPLSEEGRKLAASKYEELKNPDLATISGSPRIRTRETAYGIKEGDSSKSIDEIMSEKGVLGSPKATIDERLDFGLDVNTETGKVELEAFKKGELLKFMVEESDKAVLENNDFDKNTSYSMMAANISGIVLGALKEGSDKWHRIYEAEQEGENQRNFPRGYKDTFEKLLGTHQTTGESFLAKVINKMKGEEERTKFVEALGNRGFSETEGFDVEIVNDGKEKTIHLNYVKFDDKGMKVFEFNEDVPQEVLEEIVKEGEKFKVDNNQEKGE